MKRVRDTWRYAGRVWSLAKPYFVSEQKWLALALFASVIGLTLLSVYVDVLINAWNKAFYDTLETKNQAEFWRQMWRFTYLALFSIVVTVYRFYLTQRFEMQWRKWMTERYLTRWLGPAQAYYKMELQRAPLNDQQAPNDNPDQRIADDIRLFTDDTVVLTLGLLNAVVTLVSFVTILWVVSGPISFALMGREWTIPGYMVWVALGYAVIGTALIHFVGKPLINLNFRQQRFEADFRYGLVRVREHAESIALYQGERAERIGQNARYTSVFANYWNLIRTQKRLVWTQSFYGQLALIFPFVVAAPRFFGGSLKLGDVIQIADAFGKVQTALSWFIDAYSRFAAWKATTDRLLGFEAQVQAHEVATQSNEGLKNGLQIASSADGLLSFSGSLTTPQGASIVTVNDGELRIAVGERVALQGPSGSGKTTLFRALAGIWPYGSGMVQQPWRSAGDSVNTPEEPLPVLFLPQRPYIQSGSLRAALCYPSEPGAFDDASLQAALRDVNLAHLVTVLHEESNWDKRLSPGEQQRVALARGLLQRPRWLFMDEATAALDDDTALRLMQLLFERLPDTSFISIAHHSHILDLHQRRIRLMRWPFQEGESGTPSGAQFGARIAP